MCNQKEALQILREVYNNCLPIITVSDAILYGSYARGDYRDGSDVDIMLLSPLTSNELSGHRRDFAHISSEISMDHDVTVSLTVRSKEEFNPRLSSYHHNVVSEGIRLSAV